MKIAILTDSSFSGDIKKYENLFIAPLLIIDNNNNEYLDDANLKEDQFLNLLKNNNLKTSQTPMKIMFDIWDKILKDYDQIIFIPISDELSGQHDTYKIYSTTNKKYIDKVFVCNTKGVSIVNTRMIDETAKLIKEKYSVLKIIKKIEKLSNKFYGFIIPKELETLKKGGRISKSAAALSKLLKIVPILKYDGFIKKECVVRTHKKAIIESIKLIKKYFKDRIKTVDVAYSKMSDKQLNEIIKLIENENLQIGIIKPLSNVITSHTGLGTIAIIGWGDIKWN